METSQPNWAMTPCYSCSSYAHIPGRVHDSMAALNGDDSVLDAAYVLLGRFSKRQFQCFCGSSIFCAVRLQKASTRAALEWDCAIQAEAKRGGSKTPLHQQQQQPQQQVKGNQLLPPPAVAAAVPADAPALEQQAHIGENTPRDLALEEKVCNTSGPTTAPAPRQAQAATLAFREGTVEVKSVSPATAPMDVSAPTPSAEGADDAPDAAVTATTPVTRAAGCVSASVGSGKEAGAEEGEEVMSPPVRTTGRKRKPTAEKRGASLSAAVFADVAVASPSCIPLSFH